MPANRTPDQMEDDGVPPWYVPGSFTGHTTEGYFVQNMQVLRVEEPGDGSAVLRMPNGHNAVIQVWWDDRESRARAARQLAGVR